jgi:hypothetical protein
MCPIAPFGRSSLPTSRPGIVKGQEPVRVQTLRPKALVEGFDVGVVGWFARSAEVQRDAFCIGPQVEIA